MPRHTPTILRNLLSPLLPLLLVGACSPALSSESGDPERGPLGKADAIGSCEGACDGPALVGNCWCDDECDAYGDCCSDKVEICEASVPSFQSFETFRGGFCPPQADCSASIKLLADGSLFVDRMGEPDVGVHTATVSESDLSAAIEILTAPALMSILDGSDPACPAPTDVFESMTLVDDNGEHRTSITFCNQAPINAARAALNDLAAKYIVTSDFTSFKLFRGGFCPPTIDCTSSIELLADGSLKVDRMGEINGGVHQAQVTDVDLADAIEVLTNPDLITILSASAPPCDPPTDIFESMSLVDSAGEHRVGVTFCSGPELDAARQSLNALVEKYL